MSRFVQTLEGRMMFAGIAMAWSGENLMSCHMLAENGTFTITAPVGAQKYDVEITSGESEVEEGLGLTTIIVHPFNQPQLKQKINLMFTDYAKLHIDMGNANDSILIGATGMIANSPFSDPQNPNLLVAVITGKGNDRAEAKPGSSSLMFLTGEGNDTIYGSELPDYFDGGTGDDNMFGRGGNDRATGGPGKNTFDGGDGDDQYMVNLATLDKKRDRFNGGNGTDSVIFEGPGFNLNSLAIGLSVFSVERIENDYDAWG